MMKISLLSAVLALSASALTLAACQSDIVPVVDEPQNTALDALDEDAEPTFCGGIAGFTCPDGSVCIDDPRDDCDPGNGGADCGGICVDDGNVCTVPGRQYISTDLDVCSRIRFKCDPNLVAFSDDCGCGCEAPPRAGSCGNSLCQAKEYCCNESCGICAPIGGACTQMVCD